MARKIKFPKEGDYIWFRHDSTAGYALLGTVEKVTIQVNAGFDGDIGRDKIVKVQPEQVLMVEEPEIEKPAAWDYKLKEE